MKPAKIFGILALLLLCACARPAPPPLELTDAVISDEAVWSGEVRITGVTLVKKGAKLTILPGARIVFMPLDRDGDDIGDSELLIEGSLIAKGTAASPILFTSGAAAPKPADWKFLYLDFCQLGEIEHIISEYAYSGIQVHFCKASVKNSTFRHNLDGVRFSTVNIEVAGNLIHDNRHGLRYEERRSQAHIHHNDIRDNDIGIFVVTRSDNRALVEYNNLTGSRQYQVKMGLEQPTDVSFPRNWWGTADPKAIETTFFDQSYDPHLGRVAAPEPLTEPVELPFHRPRTSP
ncbi:right-handed parallel beta-helix repeat-containing protein [Desulfuromonas acetexigens]|uniref:Right-handed parallel beta-helix repeat-containing protein n=1 Tax=Trichloromonas acetexigens TaxID=38815 RepID=A0A550J648_9BACT|nr:right-handed parallel beta-helix repeat-containing protein [Desulfuromonas acetexigens]TRO78689.1 right-handed parallel beta-helix repeat-containing protein [Desulfuromonas acetexigens]